MLMECQQPVTVEAVADAMHNFTALPQVMDLPTAPDHPVIVTEVPNRPQPKHDREAGNGKAVTVGRIRLDEALPNAIKYVVVGHNMLRGTIGNTMLNAELVYKKGLLD